MNAPYTAVLDRRILYFWFKQNPYYCEEVEHHSPHVMVWGTRNSELLFEPYIFDGRISHLSYLAMYLNWIIPPLQSLGIESYVRLQQDKPTHFVITQGIS